MLRGARPERGARREVREAGTPAGRGLEQAAGRPVRHPRAPRPAGPCWNRDTRGKMGRDCCEARRAKTRWAVAVVSLAMCLPEVSEQSVAPVIGRGGALESASLTGLGVARAGLSSAREASRLDMHARGRDPIVECERWISQIDSQLAGLQRLSSIVEAEEMLAGCNPQGSVGAEGLSVDYEEQEEIRAMLEEMHREGESKQSAMGRDVLLLAAHDRALEGDEATDNECDKDALERERQQEMAVN